MSSRATKFSTSVGATNSASLRSQQLEEVSRIQQDITVLSHRIADLNGEAVFAATTNVSNPASSTSNFVVGLRNTAESSKNTDPKDMKLAALETLFAKIAEFDRAVLTKSIPPVDPNNSVPVRRKSAGLDLHTLPTHLHVIDRLMDLFAQSKRVTVIKTTVNGNSNASTGGDNSADKKTIENLKAQLLRATQQHEVCEAKRKRSEAEGVQLKKEVVELKQQLLESQTKVPEIKLSSDCLSEEVAALKARITALEADAAQLQDRLEVEAGKYTSILNVVFGKASRINSGKDVVSVADSVAINDCFNLPEDMRNAFQSLEAAVAGRIQGLHAEIGLLNGAKELLESEVNSVALQNSLLNSDHTTLSSEHEALKAAYHELSCESAAAESRRHKELKKSSYGGQQQQDNDLSLQGQLNDAKATIEQLQQQVYDNARKLADFDNLCLKVTDLEARLWVATDERVKAGTTVLGLTEEVAQYKKLTDTLKDKIRSLGSAKGGPTGDATREFLDSFEEVMREEMLAMKTAFETKLRVAREEAEATSRRHQQEILRMHTASPYGAGFKR